MNLKAFLRKHFSGIRPRSACRSPWGWAAAALLLAAYAALLPAAMGWCHGSARPWETLSWIDAALPAAAILLLSQYALTRWLVAIPAVLALGAYLPAGILYGKPNILVSVALLQTTAGEAAEFLSITPFRILAAGAGMIILGLAAIGAAKRLKLNGDAACLLLIAICAAVTFRIEAEGKKPESIQLVAFAKDFGTSAWAGAVELHAEAKAPAPDWKGVTAAPRYRNYVVVVGESQRRDYASVYGYPLRTTPFLERAPGLFMSGFAAPGGNTGISLPRLLSLNTPESDRFSKADNILTLANAAGFETWWLSNQGRGGAYDNPIAQIGVRAQHTAWLKGNYADPNVDDDRLLPKLEEALAAKTDKPRLIFLHLMGSHPAFCTRLSGRPVAWKTGDASMDCYLTTYRTMDALLEKAVEALKARGESWSLVYFADHGLSMERKPGTENGRELEHGYDAKQNYEVPLLMMASDIHAHSMNPAKRGGYRLLEGLADWMGIRSDSIPEYSKNPFWGEAGDGNLRLYGGKRLDALKDDPPLLFPDAKAQ